MCDTDSPTQDSCGLWSFIDERTLGRSAFNVLVTSKICTGIVLLRPQDLGVRVAQGLSPVRQVTGNPKSKTSHYSVHKSATLEFRTGL